MNGIFQGFLSKANFYYRLIPIEKVRLACRPESLNIVRCSPTTIMPDRTERSNVHMRTEWESDTPKHGSAQAGWQNGRPIIVNATLEQRMRLAPAWILSETANALGGRGRGRAG